MNTWEEIAFRCSDGRILVIAGPCAVESEERTLRIAQQIRVMADFFRAGAYKPRTDPDSFCGLREAGLDILATVKREVHLPIVTEVMDTRDCLKVAAVADVLQVGTRNSANYALLDEVGRYDRPVLLKRGMAMTCRELLLAGERVGRWNDGRVILCERGIRTFETAYRNVLDVNAIAYLHATAPFPVIADPSHATGAAGLVPPVALAAVAAGADGLIVEVHDDPRSALSDGEQSITPEVLCDLLEACRRVRKPWEE